jgi:hypothetical protein
MTGNEDNENELLARSSRLFDALGIAPTSDPAVLRAAFASAARRHHPDKGGDAGAFAEVSAAYGELMATAGGGGLSAPTATTTAAAAATSLSRHASAARTAAASLASGPPVATEIDLDECERFFEGEEEEDEEEDEEGEGDERDGDRQREGKKTFFYSYPCRCGGQFVVAEGDLRADCCEAVVPCDGCSSKVRVHYGLAVAVGGGEEEEEDKG